MKEERFNLNSRGDARDTQVSGDKTIMANGFGFLLRGQKRVFPAGHLSQRTCPLRP